jgi:uncharacterized damage-inducible protein DinB
MFRAERARDRSRICVAAVYLSGMKPHFTLMAEYNSWANSRVFRMAGSLSEEQYRRDVGVYFKSVHRTLNHILVADLIWMHRLTGTGRMPGRLDEIIHDDLVALTEERLQQDRRILAYIAEMPDAGFEERWEYRMLNGAPVSQLRRETLAHVFNHQSHHRGQAHAALTRLGVAEPESLDLAAMLRDRHQSSSTG